MTELQEVKCPICVNSTNEPYLEARNTHGSHSVTKEKFNLTKCSSCGLIYINPRPKQEDIGKYYDIDYYNTQKNIKTTVEKFLTKYFNNIKRFLITRYKNSGKLLDIGCGAGDFLQAFSTDKWELFGIEPNSAGSKISSKKEKAKILNNNLIGCNFLDSSFDVITMWHVFEHMYTPNEELSEIKRILKDDGIFILAVPNVKGLGFKLGKESWFHLDSPRHLYHYDSNTIEKILSKNGYCVTNIIFPTVEYPLDLFHSLINSFKGSKLTKKVLTLPILTFSLLFKPVASLLKQSETLIVICKKGV